jgi:hypothetical protein
MGAPAKRFAKNQEAKKLSADTPTGRGCTCADEKFYVREEFLPRLVTLVFK